MRVNSYLAFYACAVNYEELLLFMHAFLNKFHSEMDKIIKDHKQIQATVKAEERQRPTKARTVKDERTKAGKMKVIVPCDRPFHKKELCQIALRYRKDWGERRTKALQHFHRGQTPPK